MVPILDFDGQCCGVIQAINKMPTNAAQVQDATTPAGKQAIPFSRQDEKMMVHLAQHVAIAMRNAEVYREAIACSERATGLLNTIQSLSQDLGTQSLLLTLTMHASKVCSAQRSTVFILDDNTEQLWSVSTDTGAEIRIPKKAGIAGECCVSGAVINIPDAYADPRFNQQIDIKTGFRTKSILAIPMFGTEREVVGVIQMINKVSYDGQLEYFDDDDIEIMQLFATFVGPKLSHSSLMATKKEEHKSEGQMALGSASTNLAGDALHANGHKSEARSRKSILAQTALDTFEEGPDGED